MKIRAIVLLTAVFLLMPGIGQNLALAAQGKADPEAISIPASGGPPLRIKVDPRVELISVLFRMAGNPEYSQGKVDSYTADVEKQFDKVREHRAVKLARDLRNRRGVSYDACMSLAVHVKDTRGLEPLVPLKPWPEGLDKRWTAVDVNEFLKAAREFVRDGSFDEFLEQHRALYETTENRMAALMEKEGHLEWFKDYFGERPQARFTIAPALLNGGACYGAHCRDGAGREDLYCILGVWKTDANGLPEFTRDMLETVVHEFGHSYANAIIDRHESELRSAGEELFRHVSAKMRSQAYGNSQTMLRESLVRACEVRYAFRYDGTNAGQRAITRQKGRGFLWMQELSNLLADYEAHRERYPTLDAFAPRLVTFFKGYSKDFAAKQASLDAKRPKVQSMTPANGAAEVDPAITAIKVVFDRPMQDRSWSLVGSGPHCPETTGKPSYDAARTTWTVPVKLKPDWSYEFMLNSGSFDAFRSAEGVPLEPVTVRFRTAKAR